MNHVSDGEQASERQSGVAATGAVPEPVRQGTLPDSEIAALVAAAKAGEPWREALGRLQLPELSRKRHWFEDTAKVRYYLGLPTSARSLALDIGAGSGVIAAGLAASFQRVVALEHDEQWSEFMRLRFAQDGVANVEVRCAGALPLPFATDTFDLVVVNGVLEWIPDAAPAGQPPREAQLGFLQDVLRILRPGGVIGVAIENRWCLENLRGASPHGEPSFAAILPRPIADWRCRRLTGKPYRTWIYGPGGYRRLFREAGYASFDIKPVLPTYHDPRSVVSFRDGAAIRATFSPRNPLKRIALNAAAAAGVLGYVVHSYYLTGSKRPGRTHA